MHVNDVGADNMCMRAYMSNSRMLDHKIIDSACVYAHSSTNGILMRGNVTQIAYACVNMRTHSRRTCAHANE